MTINIDNWALEGIRALVATYGVDKAAKMLGIAREAMVRVLAGLPVRKGTVLMIFEGLRAVNSPAQPAANPSPAALPTKAESPAVQASDSRRRRFMKHDRNSAGGQALSSALENPPIATAGAVVIQQIQAAPTLLSEDNQTIVPREEWRPLLRRLGVPFTTPRRGLNIVVAADLEAAIRSGAKPFPRKLKTRALAAVPATNDNDNDDAVIAVLARANGRVMR